MAMGSAVQQTLAAGLTDEHLSQRDFSRLSSFIHGYAGIQLPPAKTVMLESRVRKRIRALRLSGYAEYCDYVLGPGQAEETVHLIDAVTTNKTDFFREPQHFQYLVERALPTLMREYGAGQSRTCMVWSAGCSSGEEPYTLAMVLAEFAERYRPFASMVLGTDICTEVLEHARRAIYTEASIAPVPPHLLKKYILRSKDRSRGLVRIAPFLRNCVRFRRLNFLDGDFAVREPIDIIFCRNVFIYFDRRTQEQILNRFARHLTPGGFVFLGHSETINGMDVPLVQVAPTIYRKSHAR
jgi:chemotaxis protein methyltransferase CheR